MSRTVDAHFRYLERDGITRDGERGKAYSAFEITLHDVKVGLTDNDRTEVTAGLSEGIPVVAGTKGVPSLRTAVQAQIVRDDS